MTPIVTLTMNPAIDVAFDVDLLSPGHKIRSATVHERQADREFRIVPQDATKHTATAGRVAVIGAVPGNGIIFGWQLR